MPVTLVMETSDTCRVTMEGHYNLQTVADLLAEQTAATPYLGLLVVDWRQGTQNHRMSELEWLAGLLSVHAGRIRFEVADVLRYGFARAMVPQCEARGAKADVVYRDHGP